MILIWLSTAAMTFKENSMRIRISLILAVAMCACLTANAQPVKAPSKLESLRADYQKSLEKVQAANDAVAKVAERFDGEIYAASGIWSGHSFKHLLASLAVLCALFAVSRGSSDKCRTYSGDGL